MGYTDSSLLPCVYRLQVDDYRMIINSFQNMVAVHRCPVSTAHVTDFLYLGFPFVLDCLQVGIVQIVNYAHSAIWLFRQTSDRSIVSMILYTISDKTNRF